MIEQDHPSTWQLVKIADLCEAVGTVDARILERQSFQYVDISSIDSETKTIGNVKELEPTQAPSRARQLIKTDDVLVSTVRPNLNAVACVPPEVSNEVASTGFCVLRSVPELLDPHYLFYWVQQDIFVERLSNLARGAGYPAVTDSDVRDNPILLPPLPEQQRIVAILRQADELRRLRRQADERARVLYGSFFREQFGSGAPTEKHPDTIKLKELLAIPLTSGYSPVTSDSPPGVPVLTLSAVTDFGLDPTQVKYYTAERYTGKGSDSEQGDLLITRSNTLELVGKVDMYCGEYANIIYSDLIIRIRLKDKSDAPYVLGFLRSDHLKSVIRRVARGTSSSMKKISQGDINDFDILWPNKSERDQYAGKVKSIDIFRNNISDSVVLIKNLFASLSTQAFTGELTTVWRKQHAAELRVAAARRDALLRERGARPVEPSAEERVRIEVRGKAGKSVQELMQGLFDTVRLRWDESATTLTQPLVEASRGLIGRVLAQSTQRIADSLAVPLAESARAASARMSETLAQSIGDFVQAVYAGDVPVSFEEQIAGHPREHLLRRLTVGHLLVWLTINTEVGYVTLESLYESTGLTHKALGRILDVLAAGGLITAVSLPANPSGVLVFVPAYRAFDPERDEARAADLKLLEAR